MYTAARNDQLHPFQISTDLTLESLCMLFCLYRECVEYPNIDDSPLVVAISGMHGVGAGVG